MATSQAQPPVIAGPVIVGIDGSQAAIEAARWAVAEAADLGVSLRLVYVIDVRSAGVGIKLQYAETALRAATRALSPLGSVDVETAIVYGPVDEVMVEESKAAAMVCVGSVGIGRVARALLGSTAARLAERAHCPVTIVRRHPTPPPHATIAVAVDNSDQADAAVATAMREAALRDASVLAVGVDGVGSDDLDRRMQPWRVARPGIPVGVAVAPRGLADFLAQTKDPVELAVIAGDPRQAVGLVGPVAAGVVRHARCSVLVVPAQQPAAAKADSASSVAEVD